jgi:hypothetical protein
VGPFIFDLHLCADGVMDVGHHASSAWAWTNRRLTMGTSLRRCVGSARFGIEAHEAPLSGFPAQPSQPDGLGRMCREHWKAYTAGLRKDARARKAGEAGPDIEESASGPDAAARKTMRATARAKATRQRRPAANAAELERAEALIREGDALPAEKAVRRVGEDDVQAAFEVSAAGRGTSEAPA